MMNAIPRKFRDCLALPFLLVHGIGHDERTWIPLISLCFFHQEKDDNVTWSKHMAHMMDGVIVGFTWRLIQGVETSDSIFGASGSALKL
jgi:hypothetical protein